MPNCNIGFEAGSSSTAKRRVILEADQDSIYKGVLHQTHIAAVLVAGRRADTIEAFMGVIYKGKEAFFVARDSCLLG